MTTNPDTLKTKLETWVREGTPVEPASRIMTKHGFNCKLEPDPWTHRFEDRALFCRRRNAFMNRVWLVVFTLKDGKVSGNKYYITTDFLRLAPSNP